MNDTGRLRAESLAQNVIAFYPGETPLFEGEVSVGEFMPDEDLGWPSAYGTVAGDPALDLAITRHTQHSVRTQYAGYFLCQTGNMFVCNVDLELPEQPSGETVARALWAAMIPDSTRAA